MRTAIYMVQKGIPAMKKMILVTVLLLIVAGAASYSLGTFAKEDPSAKEKPPQEVTAITIVKSQIPTRQTLPGRVTAYRQSEVRPQVDGIVTQRLFEEGSKVEKGQQLYQIDDSRYKALLNSAYADLKSAKADVQAVEANAKRSEELVKVGAVSKQANDNAKAELNRARAAVSVAQAAVDLAKVNLDYTKVYAPISGQIGRSFVTDGTLVTANQSQALAMITQLDPIYVDMQQSLAETDVTNIQEQMAAGGEIPVHLMIGKENEKAYAHQGTLKFSEVTVNELTSSVTLRALFNNPDGTLLPGAFVRALLDLGDTEVILVPQRATTRTPEGKLKVWTIDAEGKAQPRIVTASQAHEDQWIVQEGLNPGDKLIVEGYQKVQPGAPVTAVSTPTEKQVNTPPKGQ